MTSQPYSTLSPVFAGDFFIPCFIVYGVATAGTPADI